MNESLRNLSNIEYGASPKQIRSDDFTPIGIYGTGGQIGYSSETLFQGPLVVVARKGTLDNPVYVADNCWVIDTAYAVLPKINVDAKWLYYNLKHFDLKKLNESTGVPSISRDYLYRVSFEYFPFPEQRKIAHILSLVDTVIEKTETAISKYLAIKAGMTQDLFTRGIDLETGKLRPSYEEAPELYKQTELGVIPNEWESVKVSDICTMKSGDGITSKSISDYGNYPVYGGNGLRGFTASYTHDGDFVLVGRQGALCGNVNRVSGKFYASEHAVVVTVYQDVSVDWIHYVLWAMNLNQYSEASAQPGLAVSKILNLRIKKPPSIEQIKISQMIMGIDSKIKLENSCLNKYQQLKKALMSDLLTGKVRVKYEEDKVEYEEDKVEAV